MEDVKGFGVTPGRVTFFLSLFAVLGIGWNVVSYVKDAEFKDRIHDTYIAEDKAQTKEVLAELKRLNEKVAELVIIVKGPADLKQTQMLMDTTQQ